MWSLFNIYISAYEDLLNDSPGKDSPEKLQAFSFSGSKPALVANAS